MKYEKTNWFVPVASIIVSVITLFMAMIVYSNKFQDAISTMQTKIAENEKESIESYHLSRENRKISDKRYNSMNSKINSIHVSMAKLESSQYHILKNLDKITRIIEKKNNKSI